MRKINIFLGLIILAIFSLAACTSNQPANNVMTNEVESSSNMTSDESSDEIMEDEIMEDESSDEMMEDEMMEDEMTNSAHDTEDTQTDEPQESSEEMAEENNLSPTWLDYEFTDAVTGETFSISEFKGKVVLVETMAMWCSNCLRQQNQVKELHSYLGERDDFVSIGIDVDPNEDIGRLAGYVDQHGFDWLYSVAPPEVLAEIQSSLGGQFLNPPSTPIVLFDKDGQPHPLPFGVKSANQLLGFVEEYLN
jgi:thiol-disulfide isomerase/thioredoxin